MTDGPSLLVFTGAAVAFAIFAVAVRTPWRHVGFKRRARVARGEAPRLAVAHASEDAARAWLARQRCACGRAGVAMPDAEQVLVGARIVRSATVACGKCATGRRVFYYVEGQ